MDIAVTTVPLLVGRDLVRTVVVDGIVEFLSASETTNYRWYGRRVGNR